MKYRPPWGPSLPFDCTCAARICTLTARRGCSGEQEARAGQKGGARRLPPAAECRRVGLRQRAERELPGVHQLQEHLHHEPTAAVSSAGAVPLRRGRAIPSGSSFPPPLEGWPVLCSMAAACSLHKEALNTRVILLVAQSKEDRR